MRPTWLSLGVGRLPSVRRQFPPSSSHLSIPWHTARRNPVSIVPSLFHARVCQPWNTQHTSNCHKDGVEAGFDLACSCFSPSRTRCQCFWLSRATHMSGMMQDLLCDSQATCILRVLSLSLSLPLESTAALSPRPSFQACSRCTCSALTTDRNHPHSRCQRISSTGREWSGRGRGVQRLPRLCLCPLR